ncbi:MAG: NAD(P)/FAD-dependent oxidoreductase, partial [Chloroflexi bacterium]|nr:NAD(P)/FAD-dependent oxidoreductase [Chloroflexota bacterium]
MKSTKNVVVIGAGIGGLTTAAILARAGLPVTVLEAHVYPGGCAGTFFHKKYNFDAGATLAGGFYPGGPLDIVARATGIKSWPAHPAEPALVVQLPDQTSVTRWADPERRRVEHRQHFGPGSDEFWRWQERTADALWDLALRTPPWPPQTLGETVGLVKHGLQWLNKDWLAHLDPTLLADALRPVAVHLRGQSDALRLFIDAQLLIAAQATSSQINALYGAASLDLPRRGVVHLEGGIGAIAKTLAQAVHEHGGQLHYRQQVTKIVMERGRPVAVETKRGDTFPADVIVANLPPWNIATLLGADAPASLQALPPPDRAGWGAFMVYVGVDEAIIPVDFPLHHQVIMREPMGEGNTVFLSLSPAWDKSRAPVGKRALTLSTHTALAPWWTLYEQDQRHYELRKQVYAKQILTAAERALPGLREATDLIMPGTPVTFERFTRRTLGWVGGFPQTNLWRTWAPRLAPQVWMVGDSIFPGQSTAAVALGGLRVADAVLAQIGLAKQASEVVNRPPLTRDRVLPGIS